MVRACCVSFCLATCQTLYSFPKKMTEETRNKILRDLSFPVGFVPLDSFRVSAAHFSSESIDIRGSKSFLKPTASANCRGSQNYIPAIDVEEIIASSEDSLTSIKQLMDEGGTKLETTGWIVSNYEETVVFYKTCLTSNSTATVSINKKLARFH